MSGKKGKNKVVVGREIIDECEHKIKNYGKVLKVERNKKKKYCRVAKKLSETG